MKVEEKSRTSRDLLSEWGTGAWSGADTLANCNKVEHDKISKYNGKLKQEIEKFESLQTFMGVFSYPALAIFGHTAHLGCRAGAC